MDAPCVVVALQDPGAIALSDVPPKLGRAPPVTGSRLVIATSQEWVEKEQVSYVEVEDNTPVVGAVGARCRPV